MKNAGTMLLFGLAVLGMAACDGLSENVVSDVTTDTHYALPEGFQDAVRAAYEPLRSYYGQELGGNLTVYGTDQHTNAGHGGFHYLNQYDAGLNSEASPFWNLWSNFYQAINTCNAAISRADAIENLSEAEKNARLAEVRFLRAHYYFILVQHFGPLHLTLEETVGIETEAQRNSEEEVYGAIEDDLRFAIQNLPDAQDDWGRATRPAAQHMLAKVLLTRGYKDFGPAGDFAEAASLASDVIDNAPHRLLDDFEDVFAFDNQQNDEVVWAVQYTQDPLLNAHSYGSEDGGNQSHLHYRPWYEVYNDGLERALDPGYGRPWIRFRPTGWSLDNYRPLNVDSRYEKTFQDVWYYNDAPTLPDGAAVGDTAIWVTSQALTQAEVDEIEGRLPGVNLISWHLSHRDQDVPWSMYTDANVNIFPSLKKVDDFERPSVNAPEGSRDYIVYRLAETYLIAAEALLMDERPGEAVAYVNAVRRRAAYPGQESAMEITAGELDLDFILDERSRELFGEQKRWLDLKRTGKLVERVRAHNRLAADNIQEHHVLRPIPANQRQRATNEYPQNPGY